MGDNGGVVARRSCDLAAVSGLLLDVAHDGTFGHESQGQNVANGELRLLSAVHELAGVHALDGDEQLLADLVAVRVAEVHDGERSATARVVDDFLKLKETPLVRAREEIFHRRMTTRVLEKALEVNCSLHNNSPKARFSEFSFTPNCILVSTWENIDQSQGKKGVVARAAVGQVLTLITPFK